MNVSRLAAWRDVAVILLALQAFVVGLLAAAVTYRLWGALRLAHRRARPVLFEARVLTWKTAQRTQRFMHALAMSFVSVQSMGEGVLTALRHFGRRCR